MSSKFTPSQNFIKPDPNAANGEQVMSLDPGAEPVVRDFEFGRIRRHGEGEYAQTKSRAGALAATDSEREARTRKDARFAINPLLKDPLGIANEERRVIDQRVREGVAALEAEARERGRKQGIEEGRAQGFDEAFKALRAESLEHIRRVDSFLSACESAKEDIFKVNERYLMEIVFRIARMIALKEVKSDPDYVVRLAKELIQKVGVRENVTIKVNAQDFEGVVRIREGLEQALGQLRNFNIEPSNQIVEGGCMVETEWNAIDARLETQMAGIRDGLLEIRSDSNSGEESTS